VSSKNDKRNSWGLNKARLPRVFYFSTFVNAYLPPFSSSPKIQAAIPRISIPMQILAKVCSPSNNPRGNIINRQLNSQLPRKIRVKTTIKGIIF
jgi:hypothetical protein